MEEEILEIKAVDRDLVFFDTETTGLSLLKNELIEIGFVKARAKTFEFIEEGDIKIEPAHIETADPEALRLVGYDQEEWDKEGFSLQVGMQKFFEHTNEVILVGHCLPFDWMHITKAREECSLPQNYFYKGFDTFPLAWAKLRSDPKFVKYSLEELATHFEIPRGRAHRAIDDARVTYQVFLKLLALK